VYSIGPEPPMDEDVMAPLTARRGAASAPAAGADKSASALPKYFVGAAG
jgi:hypothetical protein